MLLAHNIRGEDRTNDTRGVTTRAQDGGRERRASSPQYIGGEENSDTDTSKDKAKEEQKTCEECIFRAKILTEVSRKHHTKTERVKKYIGPGKVFEVGI